MNLETIKRELNNRMMLVLKNKTGTTGRLRVVHRSWPEKVAEVDSLIHTTYTTLDDILTQQGVIFKDKKEKQDFVSQLEPIVNDIVIRSMSD